jgi:hypothetical protein
VVATAATAAAFNRSRFAHVDEGERENSSDVRRHAAHSAHPVVLLVGKLAYRSPIR